MKRSGIYIVALALTGTMLFSCEDPYANQFVAEPGSYDQVALTDTSFVATTVNATVTLTEAAANDSTELLNIATALPLIEGSTVSYILQISKDNKFSETYNRPVNKALVAGAKVKIQNADLNLIIDSMNSTAATTLYTRLVATVKNGGTTLTKNSYSGTGATTATVSVTPYSLLKPYTVNTPRLWYLIGGAIGDGSWNNSVAGLGVSLYPLNIVTGNAYNKDGDGTFTYTGYFESSKGFKIIRDLGNWNIQWGISGGNFVYNDGGSSDIKVAADGWYTITLNSVKNTLEMTAVSAPTLANYSLIGLIGDINGWGADEVFTKAASTNSTIWYKTYTFAGDATQGVKIRANGNWDVNWGGASLPYGFGVQGGDNLMYTAGTYTIIFNELDKSYYFIKH